MPIGLKKKKATFLPFTQKMYAFAVFCFVCMQKLVYATRIDLLLYLEKKRLPWLLNIKDVFKIQMNAFKKVP